MMKKIEFNSYKGTAECVSAISTDWSLTEYFKIPSAYAFTCKWSYTVDSYAGGRLYKYPETREVIQTATYVSVTTLKKDGSLHEIKVCDNDKVEILKRNLHSENLAAYAIIIDAAKKAYKNSRESISDVKIGDHVACFDYYSHDEIEHELIINGIEIDKEEGVILWGTDLTYPEDESDDYITRVNSANFLRIIKEEE